MFLRVFIALNGHFFQNLLIFTTYGVSTVWRPKKRHTIFHYNLVYNFESFVNNVAISGVLKTTICG